MLLVPPPPFTPSLTFCRLLHLLPCRTTPQTALPSLIAPKAVGTYRHHFFESRMLAFLPFGGLSVEEVAERWNRKVRLSYQGRDLTCKGGLRHGPPPPSSAFCFFFPPLTGTISAADAGTALRTLGKPPSEEDLQVPLRFYPFFCPSIKKRVPP